MDETNAATIELAPASNKPLFSIFLIVAVDVVGFAIMLPLLPFYVERTGASAFTVGLLISTYALCQLFAGPVLGQLSDFIGRKPVLLLSQIGTFLGFVLLALAHSLPLLFLARIIDGLTAGNLSVAQAYLSDNTPPAKRTKAFGVLSAAFGVGMFLGPSLGGLLAKHSLSTPIWAAAAMSGLSILATSVLLPKGIQKASAAGKRSLLPIQATVDAFRNPATSRPFALLTAFFFAFYTFASGLALFLAGRITWHGELLGPRGAGLLFAYAGLLNIVLQIFLLERVVLFFKERRAIILGFLLMVLGYAGLAVSHTVGVAIAFLTLNNLGAGVIRPVLMAQLSKRTSPQKQGLILGVNQSMLALSQVLAPLMTGALIDRSLYSSWALCAAVIALTGFIGSLSPGRDPEGSIVRPA